MDSVYLMYFLGGLSTGVVIVIFLIVLTFLILFKKVKNMTTKLRSINIPSGMPDISSSPKTPTDLMAEAALRNRFRPEYRKDNANESERRPDSH